MSSETPRQKAALWLALVFVLGIGLGGVLGYSFAHRSSAATTNPPPMSESERRARRVEEMTREIGLNPEQTKKLDEIIQKAHQEMKAIHEKAEADNEAVRMKARAEFRTYLTPEQLPKFEEFIKKSDAERKSREGH